MMTEEIEDLYNKYNKWLDKPIDLDFGGKPISRRDTHHIEYNIEIFSSGYISRQNEIDKLKDEVLHWKSNHDNQVKASRLLKERIDMPLSRIEAYDDYIKLLNRYRND